MGDALEFEMIISKVLLPQGRPGAPAARSLPPGVPGAAIVYIRYLYTIYTPMHIRQGIAAGRLGARGPRVGAGAGRELRPAGTIGRVMGAARCSAGWARMGGAAWSGDAASGWHAGLPLGRRWDAEGSPRLGAVRWRRDGEAKFGEL